ncbi:hypothetical protein LTR50_006787 [Elasticomyces elasticus]|nr:hypothetical protein LTR50_006787 [Elasticomyces elasticus]
MVDAASFSHWSVFVGMQTGNTIILGLSTTTLPSNPYAWLTTLVALASFLVGAFLTFRVSVLLSPKGPYASRIHITLLYLIQSLFILLAAALSTVPGLIPQNPPGTSDGLNTGVINNIKIVSLIPPLAIQSGMQIATSRLLGLSELPVNVLTSTYADLAGDKDLFTFSKPNIKRNRRAAAVVLLLVGAISSAWLMRTRAGLDGVLWIAGGLKLFAALGVLFFMKADPGELLE